MSNQRESKVKNAAATMRKVANQFGAAKINVLEKLGKIEKNETTEMQHETKKVEEARDHLKDIYKKLIKSHKSCMANLEDMQSVGAAFIEYGNILANNGEHPTLAGMFVKLSQFNEFLENITTKLDGILGIRMIDSLTDFVKGDIRDARYEKKKFDKIRHNYESSVEQLKQAQNSSKPNPKLVLELQQESNSRKELYERSMFETMNKLEDCNKKNDFESLERCCDYIEAYYEYFNKGYQWLSDIMPRIRKHREQIQSARRQFTVEVSQRKASLDESGKLKPRVFGCPIEDIVKRESTNVPIIVSKSVDHIIKYGLETEGIFRISGQKNHIDDLKKLFETDAKSVDLAHSDVHTVSGVLKMFLRELPDPILTHDLSEQFLNAADSVDHQDRIKIIEPLIQMLPPMNRETLKLILKMCHHIMQNQDKNRMGALNLAIVFGPNLISKKESASFSDMERGNNIVESMILYFDSLFSNDKVFNSPKPSPHISSSPTPIPTSTTPTNDSNTSSDPSTPLNVKTSSAPAPRQTISNPEVTMSPEASRKSGGWNKGVKPSSAPRVKSTGSSSPEVIDSNLNNVPNTPNSTTQTTSNSPNPAPSSTQSTSNTPSSTQTPNPPNSTPQTTSSSSNEAETNSDLKRSLGRTPSPTLTPPVNNMNSLNSISDLQTRLENS